MPRVALEKIKATSQISVANSSFMTKDLILKTSPLICSANQWTCFCMIRTSIMKEFINIIQLLYGFLLSLFYWLEKFQSSIQFTKEMRKEVLTPHDFQSILGDFSHYTWNSYVSNTQQANTCSINVIKVIMNSLMAEIPVI